MVKPYCTVGGSKKKAVTSAQVIVKGDSKRWDTRSVEKKYGLEVYS